MKADDIDILHGVMKESIEERIAQHEEVVYKHLNNLSDMELGAAFRNWLVGSIFDIQWEGYSLTDRITVNKVLTDIVLVEEHGKVVGE